MQDKINPIQKTSYTNKDFASIYPEMLDLVKQLTNKWDPSISNESDPGVILLKLGAIIADKTNYNTDTAVLETFPASVTQSTNARKLFEQLGYYMHWYNSATCDVSIAWANPGDNPDENIFYTIPKFSTICDETSDVVYTLVGPAEGLADNEFKVADQKLYTLGDAISFRAIQGIPINYAVNGVTTITYDMLDSNNRLYFPYSDVAENGVFICNEGLGNYSTWVKKDNLAIEDVSGSNYFYRFGVSQDNLSCFIEFPVNIEELMLNGLNITYIRSSGEAGNIAASMLVSMYNTVTPIEDTSITLSGSNMIINNVNSGAGGSDPESIDDAYRNYKHTVGTFKTLITLRDYFNYIMQSGMVSNGFVCDRTNDIQSTAKVMNTNNKVSQPVSEVTQHQATKTYEHMLITSATQGISPVSNLDLRNVSCEVFEDDLTAFSLKFYLLKYAKSVTTASEFSTTFDMMLPDAVTGVRAYVDQAKAITHDYVDILPMTTETPNVCMFKNRYPIQCRIVPQYSLTKAERDDVKNNIFSALYDGLNSIKLNFGDEIDIDYVYELIQGADSRIKNLSVDKIVYDTYAVCFNGLNYVEIPINNPTQVITLEYQPHGIDEDVKLNWACTVVDPQKLEAKLQWWRDNYPEAFVENINTSVTWEIWITHTYASSSWTHNYYLKPSTVPTTAQSTLDANFTPSNIGLSFTTKSLTPQSPEPDSNYNLIIPQQYIIREDLYARSVLSGSTQFLVKDETFDYSGNQLGTQSINTVSKIVPQLSIALHSNTYDDPTGNIYTLKENESVRFYSPNLIDTVNYSSYTRFEAILENDVVSDVDYRLGPSECILFYWKESSDKNDVYKYAVYGEGCIIKPQSFTLTKSQPGTTLIGDKLRQLLSKITTTPKQISYRQAGDMLPEISRNIADGLGIAYNVLSGTKSVSIRQMNNVVLNPDEYYCYWVVNDKTENNRYRLFTGTEPAVENLQTKTLGTGEYFYYTNAAMTNLVVLGSGTKITRPMSDSPWEVDVVPTDDIYENGTSALSQSWFRLPKGSNATVVENQHITVPTGYQFRLDLSDYTILEHEEQQLNQYCKAYNSSTGVTTEYPLTTQPIVDVRALIESGKQYFTNLGGTSGSATIVFKYTNISGGEWVAGDTVVGTSTWASGLSEYGVILNAADAPAADASTTYLLTLKLDNDWHVTINSSGVDMSPFDIKYKSVNDTLWTTIPTIKLGTGFNWSAIGTLSIDVSNTERQHLLSGQSLDIYCNDSTSVTTSIVGANGGPRAYLLFKEANITTGTYYWPYLGSWYTLGVTTNTSGATHRGIIVDYSSETFTILPLKDTSSVTATLTVSESQPGSGTNVSSYVHNLYVYPVTLLSSKAINSAVPGEITTLVIDDELNRHYVDLYTCTEFVSVNAEDRLVYSDDFAVNIRPNPTADESSIQFAVPKGSYLIPVYCSQEGVTYTVTILQGTSEVLLAPINSSNTTLYGGRTYYLYYNHSTDGSTTSGKSTTGYDSLVLSFNHAVGVSCVFRVDNLYKFNYSDLSEIFPYMTQSTAQGLILDRMRKYDPKQLYDYTYEVDEDMAIPNPLYGASFFDPNHVFNKYTIAQLDTLATSKTTITFSK